MVAFQVAAIENAVNGGRAALEEQGIPDEPVAVLSPVALLGRASDGRELGSLLTLPDLTGWQFDRIVATQLQDVSRQAASIERAVRPQVTHYVRALNLPSCGRCIILAGKPERSEVAFRRHPQCFPSGVVASGPHIEAAARRWYDGELVILTTASGQKLSVTGNHPVLTRGGWLAASLLREGDEVFRSTGAEGAAPLMVPNHHQVPALVEDVWDALRVNGLVRVPTSPEDFHGDGIHGEVDVAYADGALRNGVDSTFTQHGSEQLFSDALMGLRQLVTQGLPGLMDVIPTGRLGRNVGGESLGLALLASHLSVAHEPSFAAPATFDAGFPQDAGNGSARNSVLSSNGVFASAREVGPHDLFGVEGVRRPRWDAAGLAVTAEGRLRNASRGLDLAARLAGQVEADRLVDVRRVEWSGHVYSLTSSEGWLSANSLIVSNCDCLALPSDYRHADRLVTDPGEAFESMTSAERQRAFTKAGAEAIGLGADMGRVVNARSGMSTAQVFGRDLAVTPALRRQYGRGPRGENVRLMPESIAQIATSPDGHLRLLRLYGYITD